MRSFVILFVSLLLATVAKTEHAPKIEHFAQQQLTKDITRSNLHKIYLPNFTDGVGNPSILGRFFAGSLSKLLTDKNLPFTVIDRAQAHKYLFHNGWTDQNLFAADILAKFESDFAPDAIIWGKVSVNHETVNIDLTARSLSGAELFQSHYDEPMNASLQANLDAARSGSDFYFPGFDGITVPICRVCPIPAYPDEVRRRGVEGKVTLSVLVKSDGTVSDIRMVKKAIAELDRVAIDTVQTWRLNPAQNPDGQPVPVRVPIEVAFRHY